MVFTAASLSPVLAVLFGILIFVFPKLLNYLVATYLVPDRPDRARRTHISRVTGGFVDRSRLFGIETTGGGQSTPRFLSGV